MKCHPLPLVALAAVLALPAVAAQDGCAEADPCIWAVQIDEEGLSAPGGDLQGTVGDWFVFDFNNVDPEDDHVITWSGDGTSWTIGYLTTHRSDAFELTEEGTSTLTDENTGDTLEVQASLDDVSNGEDDGEGTPASGVGLLLGALAAVLWVRRR